MERSKKEQFVSELAQCFQEAQAIIVTDFKGISMESLRELRIKVRAAGCDYRVSKNTLVKIAAKGTSMERLEDFMVGNNAVASTTGDAAVLAKILCDYAKTNDKFTIKTALLGDKVLNQAQIKALASLPSREVLLGTLLGTMNAVPTGFVRTLAAIPQKLLYALSAIRDQKDAA